MALNPVDGDTLVVADQMGDSLQVVHIDAGNGTLTGGDVAPTLHQPSFVAFYED